MSNQTQFDEILQSSKKRICVIAGPGSGKTKCIIIPKAKMLLEEGKSASKLLLLSFSRLSALDLRLRVADLVRKPRASTVHSFALAYLLSEDDHAIRDRIDSIVLDFEEECLINDLNAIFSDLNKRTIRKLYRRFAAGWAVEQHDTVFEASDEEKRFKAAVVRWLSEHKAVIMGEIIYFALEHLKSNGAPARFADIEYIFVDEYQDLNKLEQEFLNLLSSRSELFIAVGDPDQSIYSFKFAHRDGIVELYNHEETHAVTLPFCGRCSTNILDAANRLLIQENPGRTALPLAMPDKQSGSFAIKSFERQSDEFEGVLNDINGRIKNGAVPNEILVLVPKRKLGEQFAEAAIEYVMQNGLRYSFAWSERMAFNSLQQEAILVFALVAKPGSILHKRAYIGLPDESGKSYAPEIAKLKQKYGTVEAVLQKADANDFLTQQTRVRQVCDRINNLPSRQEVLSRLPLAELIDNVFPEEVPDLSDLNRTLKSLIEVDDTVEAVYDKFVDHLRNIEHDESTVRIMTIMASKGLDADHVYILGCNAGNIPGENRTEHLRDADFIDEQRRLLYVGMTRAKETLMVSWSRNILYGQAMTQKTAGIRTVKRNGEVYQIVNISPFIQDMV